MTIYNLIAEYRKPSRGDNGVIGTYSSHARAITALAEWARDQWDRELTAKEKRNGWVCDGDVLVEIGEQELKD